MGARLFILSRFCSLSPFHVSSERFMLSQTHRHMHKNITHQTESFSKCKFAHLLYSFSRNDCDDVRRLAALWLFVWAFQILSLSDSRRVFLSAHTSNALEIIKFYATLAEQREEWNVKRKIPTTVVVAERIVKVWVAHFRLHTYIVSQPIYILSVFLAHLLSHSRALNTRHGARLAWFPFNIASKHTHNIYALACAIWLFKVSSYFFLLCVSGLFTFYSF